jgi:hypothetical protein
VLTWTAAPGAAFHDVYLGTEEDAVAAADVLSPLYRGRQSGTSFSLAGLVQPGGRYVWRIDEVEAGGTTIHQGVVWTFTMSALLVVDDFESYTDEQGSRIEETWRDGSRNHTGSHVSRQANPSTGSTSDHGNWSMLLAYDNSKSPFLSEAEREFAAEQNWTAGAMDTLSLRFQGEAAAFAETAPGTFTMTAAGADIWNDRDEFRYAYQRLDGDGAIVARIDSFLRTHDWAKAGVMIRASLEPASAHAFMCITGDGRRAFQNRSIGGTGYCLTAHSYPGAVSLPYWVKIERKRNQFTAYLSLDGVNWTPQPTDEDVTSYQSANPQTINMPGRVYIGLALTSHASGTATTATFSAVEITGAVAGPWQVADIGIDHPGNSPDDLYVVVEDGDGKTAMAVNPNPAAVNARAWTEWKIPLNSFAGVDLRRVRRMSLGVGGRRSEIPPASGRIYIDDMRILMSEPSGVAAP